MGSGQKQPDASSDRGFLSHREQNAGSEMVQSENLGEDLSGFCGFLLFGISGLTAHQPEQRQSALLHFTDWFPGAFIVSCRKPWLGHGTSELGLSPGRAYEWLLPENCVISCSCLLYSGIHRLKIPHILSSNQTQFVLAPACLHWNALKCFCAMYSLGILVNFLCVC